MQKMGKSRSRDGGRDIVFEVPGRLGQPTRTWIVQCKLIRNNDSLTSTKIDFMDTIYQYGANAFCVMTSGVIDSTLYDKLERITRNAKQRGDDIKCETWSRTELERFLARHPAIYRKYFSYGQSVVQPTLF